MWHKLLMELARQYLRRQARRRPPRPWSGLAPEKVRQVLLISATGLGDTLFSTPAIRALKERFPDWRLEVLVSGPYGPLLAHNPYVERLWSYPGRGWRLLRLLRELRQRQYDLVIILHGNDPEATLLAYGTGAPYIIGSAKSPLNCVYAARVERADPGEHAIETRLNYVRPLGADTVDKRMNLYLPPEESDRAQAILSRHFGGVAPLAVGAASHGLGPL